MEATSGNSRLNLQAIRVNDLDSDDACLDSIDPSLVRLGERLNEVVQQRSCAQVETDLRPHRDSSSSHICE
jgi:hypothetical protein